MMYRNKARIELNDQSDIPLSPLIDCVFLLLIFFLVTTMLKRKETIIPVTMPMPPRHCMPKPTRMCW